MDYILLFYFGIHGVALAKLANTAAPDSVLRPKEFMKLYLISLLWPVWPLWIILTVLLLACEVESNHSDLYYQL